MKIYISFGQSHIHKVNGHNFDNNSIASIECNSYKEGRKIAFKLFNKKFATSYTEGEINKSLRYFPRGILPANH